MIISGTVFVFHSIRPGVKHFYGVMFRSFNVYFQFKRRLFGQSHLSVYVDGTLRLTVNVRIPPIGEVITTSPSEDVKP